MRGKKIVNVSMELACYIPASYFRLQSAVCLYKLPGSESVDTRDSPESHELAIRTPEPGCAGHDPFDSLPIEAGQCELLLLKYCTYPYLQF